MWTLMLVNVFAIILVFLSRLQRFDFYWILFLQGFRASHFITCLYSIAPTVLFLFSLQKYEIHFNCMFF